MTQSSWIGQTLSGRYEIQELLGQGGMSAVYKANDPNLRRVVALKLIHSHLSSDPEFVRRFEEEAAAVAQLRHPNLIQVTDIGVEEGRPLLPQEGCPQDRPPEDQQEPSTKARGVDAGPQGEGDHDFDQADTCLGMSPACQCIFLLDNIVFCYFLLM